MTDEYRKAIEKLSRSMTALASSQAQLSDKLMLEVPKIQSHLELLEKCLSGPSSSGQGSERRPRMFQESDSEI